ncbi:MAG: hypothetical protein ACP5OG_03480 [Candidatus Nanoarchaeia archaeon]
MKRGKKAQETVGMSFGMIFSIILMIFFVVVAIIAIKYFMSTKKCIQIAQFAEGFEEEVNSAWKSYSKVETVFSKPLPTSITKVCFANLSKTLANTEISSEIKYFNKKYNMFFYPTKNACEIPNIKIDHINLEKMTSVKNPYCFNVVKGKVTIKLEKDYTDTLVNLGL